HLDKVGPMIGSGTPWSNSQRKRSAKKPSGSATAQSSSVTDSSCEITLRPETGELKQRRRPVLGVAPAKPTRRVGEGHDVGEVEPVDVRRHGIVPAPVESQVEAEPLLG